MPLIVPCQDLAVGMRLAEAFVWRGRTMLPGGKMMTAEDVSVLQRKYPEVVLKVGDPVLDSLVEFEDDGHEREVATTARTKIAASVAEVHQRFSNQTSQAGIDYNKSRSVVSEVMEFLAKNPISAMLIDRSVDSSSPLAEHTGTTFYLSMVLGSAVRDYVARERQRQTAASHLSGTIAMDLLPLGLGAMFMDIGMMPLSHLFDDDYKLTKADREKIRAHPQSGSDLLPATLPTGVKMIVRTHHENFAGTGYPTGMAGDTLHVFTRIVRICDAFAAATEQRAYRGNKSAARTIWEMSAGPYRHLYDPVLMKVFASLIQPFPIGAKLRLADGRFGVVVRYNRRQPFRPSIVVAFAQNGSRLSQDQLLSLKPDDLDTSSPYRIVGYGSEDLSYLHETVDFPACPPPAAGDSPGPVFKQLIDIAYP